MFRGVVAVERRRLDRVREDFPAKGEPPPEKWVVRDVDVYLFFPSSAVQGNLQEYEYRHVIQKVHHSNWICTSMLKHFPKHAGHVVSFRGLLGFYHRFVLRQ